MKTRKTKTPHIQPDAVIKAALEILDAEGLENVTLRRIAAKLNVQAPALYWHFKDKQDITDDMAQAILTNPKLESFTEPANINQWPQWLTDLMHCLRNSLISHKDGGRVVAGASFGRAHALEKILIKITRVLQKAGFDRLHASLAAATTIDYVWGFVIEEQAGTEPEKLISAPSNPQEIQSIRNTSEDDAFLSAVMEEYRKLTPTEIFDWGLQVIINGLKLALERK
ncbi:MAG: TetR/AcrR family transcriptional regulator C-terminal domain-containing protein [Candidatus Bathyarchaeia archaeon]|jgi:TetR/AcrR family tetracycline transcriptional repressor